MISVEKPGSPSEILEHHGIKGQKWGVRKAIDSTMGPKGTAQREHRKQVTKKVAIGVGVAAVVVGTAYVAYRLHKAGKLPVSSIHRASSGGKVFKNLDEAIAAKRASTAVTNVLQTSGHNHLPDPKLLAEHQATLRRLAKQADWSTDWVAIAKANNPGAF